MRAGRESEGRTDVHRRESIFLAAPARIWSCSLSYCSCVIHVACVQYAVHVSASMCSSLLDCDGLEGWHWNECCSWLSWGLCEKELAVVPRADSHAVFLLTATELQRGAWCGIAAQAAARGSCTSIGAG